MVSPDTGARGGRNRAALRIQGTCRRAPDGACAFRRRPIFIGDDFTDEAGMGMARRLGGWDCGLPVFAGDPAEVRAWLVRAPSGWPATCHHSRAADGYLAMKQPRSRCRRQLRHCQPDRPQWRHVWHGLVGSTAIRVQCAGSGNEPVSGFMETAVAGAKESRQRYRPTPRSSRPRSRAGARSA